MIHFVASKLPSAENWDFRMLNVALENATTTNGSARTVNVGRPAAIATLRYGTRGPMQNTRSVQRRDSRPVEICIQTAHITREING